jgi:hypothetical protein
MTTASSPSMAPSLSSDSASSKSPFPSPSSCAASRPSVSSLGSPYAALCSSPLCPSLCPFVLYSPLLTCISSWLRHDALSVASDVALTSLSPKPHHPSTPGALGRAGVSTGAGAAEAFSGGGVLPAGMPNRSCHAGRSRTRASVGRGRSPSAPPSCRRSSSVSGGDDHHDGQVYVTSSKPPTVVCRALVRPRICEGVSVIYDVYVYAPSTMPFLQNVHVVRDVQNCSLVCWSLVPSPFRCPQDIITARSCVKP